MQPGAPDAAPDTASVTTPAVSADARHRTLTLLDAVGAFETAPDGSWLFVNARLMAMVDAPAQSLLGRAWLQFIHPDDLERTLAEYRQARDGHRDWRHLFRMVRSDGAIVWVLAAANPLPQDPHRPGVAYIGTLTDVSGERRQQSHVEEQANAMQALQALIPQAVIVHRNGFILRANDAAARMFGYAVPEDLIGGRETTLVAPEFHARMRERREAHENFVEPVTCVRSDGERFDVFIVSDDIEFDGLPARMSVLIPTNDPHVGAIVAKRRNELAGLLLDAIPVPVHRVCMDHHEHPGLIQDANRAFCDMLGRSRDEVVCHSIFEFTAPEDLEDSSAVLRAFAESNGAAGRQLLKSYVRPDGSRVRVHISAAPFIDPLDGRRCAYVVSELVKADRE